MNDFESNPVGTAKRVIELEAQVEVLRDQLYIPITSEELKTLGMGEGFVGKRLVRDALAIAEEKNKRLELQCQLFSQIIEGYREGYIKPGEERESSN